METYIFELTHWIDCITAQRFEAIVCWDHCQMFYQPIYYVRTIAGSDKPCPFCQLQGACVDTILAAAGKDKPVQMSLFSEAA